MFGVLEVEMVQSSVRGGLAAHSQVHNLPVGGRPIPVATETQAHNILHHDWGT